MFAAAAGLSPCVAQADVVAAGDHGVASSPSDLAPITAAHGPTPARLRRTDEEQPGTEMAHVAMFGGWQPRPVLLDGTDLVDPAAPTVCHRANDRIQLALVPFSLDAEPGRLGRREGDFTGSARTRPTGGARFATNNNGNEYRNANHPVGVRPSSTATLICARVQLPAEQQHEALPRSASTRRADDPRADPHLREEQRRLRDEPGRRLDKPHQDEPAGQNHVVAGAAATVTARTTAGLNVRASRSTTTAAPTKAHVQAGR